MAPSALIIVMGTSGCGKSSVGLAIAEALGVPFIDGDDLHPASNIQKMSRNIPLTDEDRYPWLKKIYETAYSITNEKWDLIESSQGGGAAPPAEWRVSPDSLKKLKPNTRHAIVVGCSALRVKYRDILRGDRPEKLTTYFVYLHGTRPLLLNRMKHRPGHFFKPSMLDSQLATLEIPQADEPNVATVNLGQDADDTLEKGLEPVISEGVAAAQKWIHV